MRYMIMLLFLSRAVYATAQQNPFDPQAGSQVQTDANKNSGIDFKEWESEFDSSMAKARADREMPSVDKCSVRSRNCQFIKLKAQLPQEDELH